MPNVSERTKQKKDCGQPSLSPGFSIRTSRRGRRRTTTRNYRWPGRQLGKHMPQRRRSSMQRTQGLLLLWRLRCRLLLLWRLQMSRSMMARRVPRRNCQQLRIRWWSRCRRAPRPRAENLMCSRPAEVEVYPKFRRNFGIRSLQTSSYKSKFPSS